MGISNLLALREAATVTASEGVIKVVLPRTPTAPQLAELIAVCSVCGKPYIPGKGVVCSVACHDTLRMGKVKGVTTRTKSSRKSRKGQRNSQ